MTCRLGSRGWLLLAVALGCGSSSAGNSDVDTGVTGGQTGEEGIGCQPVETTRLAWSERSRLGFSADEFLGAIGGEHATRLTYDDGTSTTLNLELVRGETAVEFQEREWVSDDSRAELAAAECPDVVAIPVTLTFSTGDDGFAESWSFELLAEATTRATAQTRLDLAALHGNFMVTQVDPTQFDDVLAYLALTFASDDWSGTISDQATTTGSGPDGNASARSFDIASF